MSRIIVAKFGGSSLCNAGQIERVAKLIVSDPSVRFVVVSAPGKRTPDDQKITDLLYLCHTLAMQRVSFDGVFAIIAKRFTDIVHELGLSLDISWLLNEIVSQIVAGCSADYVVSRGEYLNARIVAAVLNWDFVDATKLIRFAESGELDWPATYEAVSSVLVGRRNVVVPGFYGSLPSGAIKTFSRGGSDITGSIIATCIQADVYQNWTDVSGLLSADPRVVKNPRPIPVVTYKELRELSYMGATVFHDDAILPARKAGVSINIRNTNDPSNDGTLVVADTNDLVSVVSASVTGIAGRKNFTVLTIDRAGMNKEIGYVRMILSVFETNGICFEHMPSGIDTVSFVISEEQLIGKKEKVEREIRNLCKPDFLEWLPTMALFAVVGRGMRHHPGTAGKLFKALGDASINIRMIAQGSGELSIIVGVENDDLESAIRVAYDAFFPR
jgi:aspartate kinase